MSFLAASGYPLSEFLNMIYNNKSKKKEVVVVGYGWAGKSFSDKIDTNKYNVTVISKTNYMLNTTKLKNSIDYLDYKLIVKPINNKINFINQECFSVNEKTNNIKINNKDIDFDYLIIQSCQANLNHNAWLQTDMFFRLKPPPFDLLLIY